MSEKIALVGGGGREDALARKLFESGAELITIMPNDNPSIRSISTECLVTKSRDANLLSGFIMDKKPDLVYVSPDSYLETNLVDKLEFNKIKVACPSSTAFQIESSKIFMRQLMKRYGIPGNLKYEVLDNEYDIQKMLSNTSFEFAIKPSGLTGGKGVRLTDQHFNNRVEAIDYAKQVFLRDKKVLIEEAVRGEEFSVQLFTDGMSTIFAPLAQDYKRLYENDKGPNTGGMGSITDVELKLPFIRPQIYERAKDISKRFVEALAQDGQIFRGVLYVQFMQTKDDLKVIEVNGRLADPEGMNILTVIEGDVTDLLFKIADAELKRAKITFRRKATTLKYLVPPGYGISPKPDILRINTEGLPDHVHIYYSSVEGEVNEVKMTDSRAIAIVAESDSIPDASSMVEMNLWRIRGNYEMRHDIGSLKFIEEKVEKMKTGNY
ncbi:MAG: phosphoribosylamine--glycine ligase [Cuniculiplasma sp.]